MYPWGQEAHLPLADTVQALGQNAHSGGLVLVRYAPLRTQTSISLAQNNAVPVCVCVLACVNVDGK